LQDAPIKGTFSFTFGSAGSGPGQFMHPSFLASSADELFVAGHNNPRVDVFSVKGEFKVSIGGPNQGDSDGLFKHPFGVRIHGDELFVSDYVRQDVQVFSVNHERKFLRKFDKGHVLSPGGLCVVGDSEVWMSDSDIDLLVVFDIKTGQLLKTIGTTQGSGDEQFDFPCDVCAVGEEVFVCDSKNKRLQVLSKAGKFVRRIGFAGQFVDPTGLCFHAGEVYVSDFSGDCIVVVDPASGKTLRTFGKTGTGDGEFNGPYGVAVLQGQLFVSDHFNHRIQSFV
jgi:DNA-binding beta-propeller fold protein YncE